MSKNIFDLVKDLTEYKTKWEDIDDGDKKNYSIFMINRILSMSPDLVEIVAEYQHILQNPETHYKFYYEILPKKKMWLKYITAKKDKGQNFNELIELISTHLMCSIEEANDNLNLLFETRMDTIPLCIEFCKSYGYDDATIKKQFHL